MPDSISDILSEGDLIELEREKFNYIVHTIHEQSNTAVCKRTTFHWRDSISLDKAKEWQNSNTATITPAGDHDVNLEY